MKKARHRSKQLLLVLFILLSCVGCDQATKFSAKQFLSDQAPISLMGDVVRLQVTENKGAFLSLGASLPDAFRFWVFTVATSLVLTALLLYLMRSSHLAAIPTVSLSLILGGGASNLIDRAIHNGAVLDFLNLGIGDLRTGIFNVADLAITAGVGLFLLAAMPKDAAQETRKGTPEK